MRKAILIIAALSALVVGSIALAGSGSTNSSGRIVSSNVARQCVYIDMRPGQTHGDLSVLPVFKTRHCIVGKRGLRGLRGPVGPASTDPNDPEIQNPEIQDPEVQNAEINDPDPNDALLRLTGDFAGTNASVATSLDGVQFGPYADGGTAGGSVLYNGANGQTLASITQLSYTIMHSSADDSSISTPYLRIFLEGDSHDVIFDATECATTVPAEDTFTTYQVVGSDVRYDDDSCDGVPPDQQPWATVVAAHGTEVISGIYVTTGFAGGASLSAILRTLTVNGTSFTFGAV